MSAALDRHQTYLVPTWGEDMVLTIGEWGRKRGKTTQNVLQQYQKRHTKQ